MSLKQIQANWIRIQKGQNKPIMQRREKIKFEKYWVFRCITVRNVLRSYCKIGCMVTRPSCHRLLLKHQESTTNTTIKLPKSSLWVESYNNCWTYKLQSLQKLEISGQIRQQRLKQWLKKQMEKCFRLSRLLHRKGKDLKSNQKAKSRNQIRLWLIRNRIIQIWLAVRLNHYWRMLLEKQRFLYLITNQSKIMPKIIGQSHHHLERI